MNYHSIYECDMANGTGLRVVLFLSGCNHHCKGCQNPETWSETSGKPFDDKILEELLKALKKPYIEGITLSGGDPFFPSSRPSVLSLLSTVKALCPGKNVWVYTGYLFEDIKDDSLTTSGLIDVIVDGRYDETCRTTDDFRGSTNQRFVDVKKSLLEQKVVEITL